MPRCPRVARLSRACAQRRRRARANITPSPPPALPRARSAPAALAPKHPWEDDLCHVPPNLCSPKGQLLSLSLRDGGLRCPGFPREVSALGALQRLDLSGNDVDAPLSAAAAVRGGSLLRARRLHPCDVCACTQARVRP